MQAIHFEETVARNMGFKRAAALFTRGQSSEPIAFSRSRTGRSPAGHTNATPPDAAFVLLVALGCVPASDIWINGHHGALPAASPGDTFVFGLGTNSVGGLTAPDGFLRFYLPAASLDRLHDDQGSPRVPGRHAAPLRIQDPVMQGLALSLLPVLEEAHEEATLFLDSVALAFHAHVMRRYGGVPASVRNVGSGLAPWQLRRVCAYVEANLEENPSIADLAGECRLSPGHFARAFATSTGTSPHKWLVNRRIERAKALLLGGGQELSQIALACGFVDQSHFTRVFVQSEGQTPGRWRRLHCN